MHPKLRSAARIVKQAISTLALLLLLFFVAATVAAYLAVTGKSLTLLRFTTARLGLLLAGQRTQQLSLDVQLHPAEGHLSGTATLVVQNLREPRQRFYFLLNDGLRLRRGQAESTSGTSQPASVYQLSLLTVVDVGTPVPKDGTVKLTLSYDGTPTAGMLTSPAVNPQRILLDVDSFWYPNDVQGFFTAEVRATLPASMTVVHNAINAEQFQRGNLQQIHWTSQRPVAGLALVAGQFRSSAAELDGTTYRLYLPADVELDAARIFNLMRDANGTLQGHYGSAGLAQLTLFVDRTLPRSLNDGSGLIGLPIQRFRTGDYGFSALAHELAHQWWGGTVSAQWLTPGTGGEFIVDSLAEFSSLVATETEYGSEALRRRRTEELYDPARAGVLEQMSVLDTAVREPMARDTIYRKGPYAVLMLRRALGDEACFAGLREFLQRFKFQQVTDHDLQQVLEQTSQQNLDRFFTDWLRTNRSLDLALDSKNPSEMTVSNLGSAAVSGDLDLWMLKKGGATEPTRATVHLGDRLPFPEDVDFAVLDPLLVWPDVQRENNRYPRRLAPVYVAVSSRSEFVVTRGERFSWSPAAVAHIAADGRTLHAWDFPRGMADPPSWFPDGSRIVASYADAPDALPAVITLTTEGAQRTVGRGTTPAPASDGAIYASKQDRVVRFDPTGTESTVVRHRGTVLDRPVPSPDGQQLAYTAAHDNLAELHVVARDGSNDRVVLSWDRDRMLYRWATDGTRLYVVVGRNWDWQLWEVPVDSGPTVTLAAGMAAVFDLAVSPDGAQLAFTAAPEIEYPNNRGHLYVLRLRDRTVRDVDLPGADLGPCTWVDPDSVMVVAADTSPDWRWVLPPSRTLKRITLSDGSVRDLAYGS